MQLPNKIIHFWHFASDECCGPSHFGTWHEQFAMAMLARQSSGAEPGEATQMTWGTVQGGFASYTLPGTHDCEASRSLRGFGDIPQVLEETGKDLRAYWLNLWAAIRGGAF